ncbi:MAG: hypothetical protein ABJC09_14550 [Terriglobia bacterium]
MSLEDNLREALRREMPSAGFAAKVLARTTLAKTPTPVWRRPVVWALAAGLAVAALVPPAVVEYRRREEARGLEARRQLLVALSITRTKLLQVKQRVQRNPL